MKDTLAKTACAIFALLIISCGGSDKKTPAAETGKPTDKKDSAPKPAAPIDTRRPPIINISDTLSAKLTVIYMKDSAATTERIGLKLGEIYGPKLGEVLKQNKIKMTGAPMAWYKSQKAPFFFEAGVPVSKAPAKLPKGVFVKEVPASTILVAHFYGPYDMTSQAYEALTDRMKDTKQKAKAAIYEIYVADPMDKDGKMLDPYKVRTDIVLPVY